MIDSTIMQSGLLEASDLVMFLGRFHPLLVHLPIGFLLMAFLMECWEYLKGSDHTGQAVPFALFLGAISAIGAALTGYLLSVDGGYGEHIVTTHMWLGIGVAVLSMFAFVLRSWFFSHQGVKRIYAGILSGMVICLMAAGHYGGSLTHGSDYLFEYMPNSLRSAIGMPPKSPKGIQKIENLDSARVFEDIIHPILDTRCVSCHNPEKKKGELLLTSYETLMEGGESGPSLTAGSPDSSDLIRRLLLPEADDDHMPPEGKLQLSSDQIDLIHWWVGQGAPTGIMVSELETSDDISEALQKLTVEGTPFLERTEVPPGDTAMLDSIRQQGIAISSIADGNNFLQVSFSEATEQVDSIHVKLLMPLSEQITWLDMGGKQVEDEDLKQLGNFRNMTRLYLDQTDIGDTTLEVISRLEHLEYLNLYGTHVTDKGLSHLIGNKKLRSLYVWQTNVTGEGIQALTDSLPELYVDEGWASKN